MPRPTIPPTVQACLAPEAGGKEQPARPFTGLAWWLLVALSLAADFAMVPIVTSSAGGPPPPLLAGALGSTLAQGSLLAAWLVLRDAPFSRRLAGHWAIASGLWLVWFVGLSLTAPEGADIRAIGLTVACFTPLVSLGAQLPIWAMRHQFGWRLTRLAAGQREGPDQRLSIRDLLIATLVVAATFALARAAPALQQESEIWFALFIGLAIASVVSTIAIVPAALMLLRPRSFARGLALTGGYTVSLVALHWMIAAVVHWYGGRVGPGIIHADLSVLMLSYALTCCLAAYVARGWGYRLASRTSSAPAASS